MAKLKGWEGYFGKMEGIEGITVAMEGMADMSQLPLFQKVECGGGPFFKVVFKS